MLILKYTWYLHITYGLTLLLTILSQQRVSRLRHLQRSAKVDAPGCVNTAGKLGRSDKQQQ